MAARIETASRAATMTSGEASSISGAVFSSVIGRKKKRTALANPVISSRPVP